MFIDFASAYDEIAPLGATSRSSGAKSSFDSSLNYKHLAPMEHRTEDLSKYLQAPVVAATGSIN